MPASRNTQRKYSNVQIKHSLPNPVIEEVIQATRIKCTRCVHKCEGTAKAGETYTVKVQECMQHVVSVYAR